MKLFPNRPLPNILTQLFAAGLILVCAMGAIPTRLHAQEVLQENAQIQVPTIIGGEEAIEDAYPWAVALLKVGPNSVSLRQFCGGTLIASEWVLTAAHCTYSGSTERTPESFNALVGATTLASDASEVAGKGKEIRINAVVRHPDYDRTTASFDIALLHLARPVTLPTINLGDASLLAENASIALMVLGWGKTENVARSNDLRQVNVPLVDRETCQSAYAVFSYVINESMICAGYAQGGKDACTGDSGGPLVAPILDQDEGTVLEWVLVGVVSWGRGCAKANAYGVYANVAFVTEWINDQMATVSGTAVTPPVNGQATPTMLFLPIVQQ